MAVIICDGQMHTVYTATASNVAVGILDTWGRPGEAGSGGGSAHAVGAGGEACIGACEAGKGRAGDRICYAGYVVYTAACCRGTGGEFIDCAFDRVVAPVVGGAK